MTHPVYKGWLLFTEQDRAEGHVELYVNGSDVLVRIDGEDRHRLEGFGEGNSRQIYSRAMEELKRLAGGLK